MGGIGERSRGRRPGAGGSGTRRRGGDRGVAAARGHADRAGGGRVPRDARRADRCSSRPVSPGDGQNCRQLSPATPPPPSRSCSRRNHPIGRCYRSRTICARRARPNLELSHPEQRSSTMSTTASPCRRRRPQGPPPGPVGAGRLPEGRRRGDPQPGPGLVAAAGSGHLVCCDVSEEWTCGGPEYWEASGVALRQELDLWRPANARQRPAAHSPRRRDTRAVARRR